MTALAVCLAAAIEAAERTILPRMKSTEIDLSQFNMDACRCAR